MRAQFGGLDDLSPTSDSLTSDNGADAMMPSRTAATIMQIVTPILQQQSVASHIGNGHALSSAVNASQQAQQHRLHKNTRELVHQMSRTLQNTTRTLKRSRLIHVFYIVLLLIYTLIGAVLFQKLDGEIHDAKIYDYEHRCDAKLADLQAELAARCRTLTFVECEGAANASLTALRDCFNIWHKHNIVPTKSMSDIYHSMFYAFSVYTTIGYGNVACESSACRHGTTLYAILGIPLFFAFLHDVSNVMGQQFMRMWNASQRVKKRWGRWQSDRRHRTYMKTAPKVFVEDGHCIADDLKEKPIRSSSLRNRAHSLSDGDSNNNRDEGLLEEEEEEEEILSQQLESDSIAIGDNASLMIPQTMPVHSPDSSRPASDSNSESPPRKSVIFQHQGKIYRRKSGVSYELPATTIPTHGSNYVNKDFNSKPGRQPSSDSMTSHRHSIHKEQRRVFVGAIITFVVYLILVSALMAWMENWSFTDAFYFLFTSVALIGFGDVFPDDPSMVLINCAFIIFGIALFGMCYFILQEEIRMKASQATRHARRSISRIRHRLTPSPMRREQSPLTALGSVKRRLSAPALANRVANRRRNGSPNGSLACGSPKAQKNKSLSVNMINETGNSSQARLHVLPRI